MSLNQNNTSSLYQCSTCGQWIGSLQAHICSYKYPYQDGSTITLGNYYKPLSSYTLEELITELKLRKSNQDVKVKELEKEVELQKQLDKMLEDVK